MIELNPATALMLYLALTLMAILGIWISSHYRSRKRRFMPMEKELVVCEFCHFAYLDAGAQKVTRCPQCESFNQKSKR